MPDVAALRAHILPMLDDVKTALAGFRTSIADFTAARHHELEEHDGDWMKLENNQLTIKIETGMMVARGHLHNAKDQLEALLRACDRVESDEGVT